MKVSVLSLVSLTSSVGGQLSAVCLVWIEGTGHRTLEYIIVIMANYVVSIAMNVSTYDLYGGVQEGPAVQIWANYRFWILLIKQNNGLNLFFIKLIKYNTGIKVQITQCIKLST